MTSNRLFTTIVWLGIALTSGAQNHNASIWLRTTASAQVSEKIKIDNEIQHRRQNGYANSNMFSKHLMFSYRTWVSYQHNEDVKFLVSPFALFRNYRLIKNQTDETAPPVCETRLAAAVEMQHPLSERFYLTDRTGIESRFFDNDQHNIIRGRNRFGFRYKIGDRAGFTVYDELFFNLAGANASHFFDHDRIGIDLEYQVLGNFRIDVGYIHISRLPLSSPIPVSEHTIFLHTSISLSRHK